MGVFTVVKVGAEAKGAKTWEAVKISEKEGVLINPVAAACPPGLYRAPYR